MRDMLEKLGVWERALGGTAAAWSEEEINQMFVTGEGPWCAAQGVVGNLYYGKLYYRCCSDVTRCEEEMKALKVELSRLRAWLARRVSSAEAIISEPDLSIGCAMLIKHECRWMARMLSDVDTLAW